MGKDVRKPRRALLVAWLALAIIAIYVSLRGALYYARVVATTGRWYDYEAVTRLTPALLAVPFLFLLINELAPTRRKLFLASCAPFLVTLLFLEAAALLAGNPPIHDAFELAVTIFMTALALYWLATELARGEGA